MNDHPTRRMSPVTEWVERARDAYKTMGDDGALPIGVLELLDASATRYEEKGELGRGGMGRVCCVMDNRLMREVAMKCLDPALEHDPAWLAGFVEEAQIAGQLEHPNIVPVHDIGVSASGGVHFTMKLVRGEALSEWLADPKRPVGAASRLADGLEVMLKVCDAMAFAHSRGVIHRDLKPSNIMVGQFGEVYVMDWGLARVIGEGVVTSKKPDGVSLRTHQGAVGTPAYMSPEQAQGRVEDCDERTDVFGLGAVLFEIVTGVPPYGAVGTASMDAIRRGEHTPAEEVLHGVGVSKRILRVIEKSLSRERESRHQSVVDLKTDIQRFLRGGLYLPRKAFAPGTRIISEGEQGDAAYIIVRGECVAYKTVGGGKRILRTMGKGDVFGELAILSDRPRSATVEAVDTVTALVVDRSMIEDEIGYDSWMGALVKALAARFRELDAVVSG